MTAPQRIALVPNRLRPAALELATRTLAVLGDAVKVVLLHEDAAAIGRADLGVGDDALRSDVDVAIALGGDGTMLRTVDLTYGSGAAVLGINVGRLGYLTEVEPAELDHALTRVVSGDFAIENRTVLQVDVRADGNARQWFALNEMVLEKVRAGRLVRLGVAINGRPFTTYFADGVIVATPTGSTAYSFSVRGPIVSPRLDCLVLTPVSPHMLFDRSLVLDPRELLEFEVLDGPPVACTLDGRECGEISPGSVVECRVAAEPARLVTFDGRDFHQLLAEKFSLGPGGLQDGD